MAFPLAALGLLAGSAAAGGLSSKFAKKPKFQQVNRFRPDQEAAQKQTLQMALSGLQDPSAGFQPIANQARQQFNTETVPSLAERFTAMGNGQRSSAFQGALGSAGADLESQLAALQAQYGMQNRSQLMQLLGLGLEPSFETAYQPGQPSFLQGAFGGLSSGLGSLGSAGLLGGMGGLGMGQQTAQSQQLQQLQAPGAASTTRQMFSPQALNPAQANFQRFLGSGQTANPLSSRFFNPMMQGY